MCVCDVLYDLYCGCFALPWCKLTFVCLWSLACECVRAISTCPVRSLSLELSLAQVKIGS